MKRIVTALIGIGFATFALADGAATFKAKCAACHGQEGVGGVLYKKSIQGEGEAEVAKMIKEGKGKMKPVQLDPADAQAVAKYVAGLKK
jgi:mono/diheme cytochrome c family protein